MASRVMNEVKASFRFRSSRPEERCGLHFVFATDVTHLSISNNVHYFGTNDDRWKIAISALFCGWQSVSVALSKALFRN